MWSRLLQRWWRRPAHSYYCRDRGEHVFLVLENRLCDIIILTQTHCFTLQLSNVKSWWDSLHRVVAGEWDQSSKRQREGVKHLRSRVQPRRRIQQLVQLNETQSVRKCIIHYTYIDIIVTAGFCCSHMHSWAVLHCKKMKFLRVVLLFYRYWLDESQSLISGKQLDRGGGGKEHEGLEGRWKLIPYFLKI